MQLDVSGHHVDVTEALKNYVKTKFDKLERQLFTYLAEIFSPTQSIATCMRPLIPLPINSIVNSSDIRKNGIGAIVVERETSQ